MEVKDAKILLTNTSLMWDKDPSQYGIYLCQAHNGDGIVVLWTKIRVTEVVKWDDIHRVDHWQPPDRDPSNICPYCRGTGLDLFGTSGGSCPHCFNGRIR